MFHIPSPNQMLNIWKIIKSCWPKVRNLYRPKLLINLSSKRIKSTKKKDNTSYDIPYFCLSIKNITNKTVQLNSEKIGINNSFYHGIIFNDIKNDKWWNLWDSSNDILIFYRENFDQLKNKFIILVPGEEKIFPMHLPINSHRIISDSKHNSLIFFEKNKISVGIETNGKIYEYSLKFRDVCEKFMAYSASDFETTESEEGKF